MKQKKVVVNIVMVVVNKNMVLVKCVMFYLKWIYAWWIFFVW